MSADDLAPAPDPAAPAEEPPAVSRRPDVKRFRKRFTAVRLSPEEAARQGRISQGAWLALGGRDAAIAFLNTHHDALGGRPIDLAVASDEGLDAAERELAALGEARRGD